jgi:TonB family protein
MMKSRALLFFGLVFALVSSAALAHGQAANQSTSQASQASATAPSASADPVMPKDPNALMQLAARVNGLAGLDKPWRLKANYQTFDADGKPKDQGTFEEWWAGPEKYKISYTSPGFNQVQYRNGNKTAMLGDVKWPPMVEAMVEQLLVHPMPMEDYVERHDVFVNPAKIGSLSLRCFRFMSAVPPKQDRIPIMFPVYCFGGDLLAVRVEAPSRELMAEFNNVVSFDGHYFAKQIHVVRSESKHPLVNVGVTEFGPMDVAGTDLTPPPSAVSAPPRANSGGPVQVANDVMAGNRIGGDDVRYPLAARQERVQGTVIVVLKITKTGEVTDAKAVSGPSLLQQAALDAVKTWQYKPYLLDGEPVDVETQVNVVFRLGGR